jgi:hypothetical protein
VTAAGQEGPTTAGLTEAVEALKGRADEINLLLALSRPLTGSLRELSAHVIALSDISMILQRRGAAKLGVPAGTVEEQTKANARALIKAINEMRLNNGEKISVLALTLAFAVTMMVLELEKGEG